MQAFHIPALITLGDILIFMDRLDEAQRVFEHCVTLDPKQTMCFKKSADVCFTVCKYSEAINHLINEGKLVSDSTQSVEEDLLEISSPFRANVGKSIKKVSESQEYFKEHQVLAVLYHVGK